MTLLVAAFMTAAVAVALGGAGASASSRPSLLVTPTQELATLQTPHAVVSSLDSRRTVRTVPAWGPITGEPTVLPVVAQAVSDGTRYLRVMLPGRPNGSTGWIAQRGTELSATSWHIVVSTSLRRVFAYRLGHLVVSFAAIVGKPSTPTPEGQFYVEESVLMPPGSAGAPFALALSARSRVLQEFEGGPGQIAIHGVENLGGTLGTAESHGCIRLATPAISWLAARIAPGTPVTIIG